MSDKFDPLAARFGWLAILLVLPTCDNEYEWGYMPCRGVVQNVLRKQFPSAKPIDLLLDGLPGVTVAMADSRRLGNGLCVAGVAGPGADQVRVYDEAGCFLGLGALGEDGVLRPRRWLAAAS